MKKKLLMSMMLLASISALTACGAKPAEEPEVKTEEPVVVETMEQKFERVSAMEFNLNDDGCPSNTLIIASGAEDYQPFPQIALENPKSGALVFSSGNKTYGTLFFGDYIIKNYASTEYYENRKDEEIYMEFFLEDEGLENLTTKEYLPNYLQIIQGNALETWMSPEIPIITLTHLDEKVACGKIELTDEYGTLLKGIFKVDVINEE